MIVNDPLIHVSTGPSNPPKKTFVRRAIAFSLQGSAHSPVTTTALSDNGEEARFQADLARAIAASKHDLSPATSIATLSSDSSQIIDDLKPALPSTVNSQSNSSFLRERAQLEQERLARLKRLRDEPHPQEIEPPMKHPTLSSTEPSSAPASEAGPSQSGSRTVDEDVEVFWDGELRQTANAHVELGRNGEDGRPIFRLSQIIGDVSRFFYYLFLHPSWKEWIQKSQIELAIISTYALQLSWIYTFFHPSTPVVLVTQPSPSENGNPTIKEVLPNWIRVTPFLRGGRGVMHMKVRASDLLFSFIHLMVVVFLIVLSDGKITCRCLDRQSHGSRLAGHRKYCLGARCSASTIAYSPPTKE